MGLFSFLGYFEFVKEETYWEDQVKPCQVLMRGSDLAAVYTNPELGSETKEQKPIEEMQKDYLCQKCGRNFPYSISLNRHKRYVCGVEPKFVCDYCSHKSKRKSHVKAHIVDIHLKAESDNKSSNRNEKGLECPFKCKKCGRNYLRRDSLYRHVRFECGVEAQFVCDYCGYRCKHKGTLVVHISNVHLKSGQYMRRKDQAQKEVQYLYKCDQCGRTYFNKQSLNRHKRYECGVEPKFECDYCGHKAKQKTHIANHIFKLHLKHS